MRETTQIQFLLNQQNYGIDIMEVRSVEKYEKVSPVLGAPEFVKGVLNLRGELIPVYSVRRKFRLPDCNIDDETKLLIVKINEMSVALEVDKVIGIVNVSEKETEKRPQIFDRQDTDFVGKVADLNGNIIILLDLASLITEKEQKAMKDMLDRGKE